MTLDEFRSLLEIATAPENLSPPLRAMWEDGRGHWETAHTIAQDIDTKAGSWIHAYLHRKEGDLGMRGIGIVVQDCPWRRTASMTSGPELCPRCSRLAWLPAGDPRRQKTLAS
jgi:hypothetical protein